MMPFLYSNDLSTEKFIEVIKEYSIPAHALLMAFSPAEARFDTYRYDKGFLAATEQGRIFWPEGELKWRRLADLMRVVYLGNMLPPPGLIDFSSELEGLASGMSDVILWGARTDIRNEWIEQQVPRRFAYPISSNHYPRGRAAIATESWVDSAGRPRFARYHGLKEIPKDQRELITERTIIHDVEAESGKRPRLLPYAVETIEIENFQCIKRATIRDLHDEVRWVFLLGDNGSGKTAFLQALTIGVCGTKNALNLLEEQRRDCRITVHLWEDGRQQKYTISRIANMWSWSGERRPDYYCAYGPSRLQIQGDASLGQEREYIDPEKSLLDQSGNLRNIERWILGQKLREREGDYEAKSRLQNTMRILTGLLPHVSEIRLENDVLRYMEKGYPARIHEIASGHKSILAMVGDILIRLFEMQPKETDLGKLKGIVVIDELDVHLHPICQRQFPTLLSKAFPMVQFICSTHSPIPLLGAPEGSRFFVVERDEENGTIVHDPGVDVSRLHPNALLTSPLFKLDAIFSEGLKDYANLDPEDDYSEITDRRRLEQEIEKASLEANVIPKDWLEE